MNSPFVARQAEALAELVRSVGGGDPRRIDLAYRLALARPAKLAERDRAVSFLRAYAAQATGADPPREAWSAFCQALFAGAEFRYLD